MWFNEALRLEGMFDWVRQEVRDEFEPKLAEAEQKLVEAEQQRAIYEQQRAIYERQRAIYEQQQSQAEQQRKTEIHTSARIMKDAGVSIEVIAKAFSLSAIEIEKL